MVEIKAKNKHRYCIKREDIDMITKTDVLLVTASPVESRAVIDAISDFNAQPPLPLSVEDRVYQKLGEIGGVGVFLAKSEIGSVNLGSSLQTVQKAIEALRPTAVFLVGIAYGIDESNQKIGDVLVSKQLLLWESQRIGENKIVLRGDKPHASPRLINYLDSARLHWNNSSVDVHFGLILSGEKLVDNIDYRKELSRIEPEAIGGEMEGAGLYVACQDAKVDWVLVKSICDWADGRKRECMDDRQQLAARNTAAFIVHALKHVSLNQLNSRAVNNEMDEVMLLMECIEDFFDNDDDLRNFCFLNFKEVYRNLTSYDRPPRIRQEIISYCKTRGITDELWALLKNRNKTITKKYRR